MATQTTYDLEKIARRVMLEKGLLPDFSDEAIAETEALQGPAKDPKAQDLTQLPWCSIDNDDSRDLDQLSHAETLPNGNLCLWVAVADVDALVKKGSALDQYAQTNTTSVYTPAKIFSMLPEKLSTNLTSLNEGEDRLAMVVKMELSSDMTIVKGEIFPALVHNYAQLNYNELGAWLEKKGPFPAKIASVPGLEKALYLQHAATQKLKEKRHEMGSLTLASTDIEAKVKDDKVDVHLPIHNDANELIEHLMISANNTMAQQFRAGKVASLRRVVRTPKYWERIREVAVAFGEFLPETPDSLALDHFLVKRKAADPENFPDLSLTIIKLLGRGEYVVETGGDTPIGHFGLALREYTHSTAPNRRYPDLIAQRQFKAFFKGEKSPYTLSELQQLAEHCTNQEDAANKVERHMMKSAAALLLLNRRGDSFKGVITGVNEKGTWVRIFNPPAEGRVIRGVSAKTQVGDHVTVRLVSVDVPKGYIDFSM